MPKRCTTYNELALINRSSVTLQQQLAGDWPQLRTKLAVAFARNRELYDRLAAETTGTLHADALVVAAFMPRSRTLLLHSKTFATYRADSLELPGVAEVQAAATRLNSDTAHNCPIQTTPTT